MFKFSTILGKFISYTLALLTIPPLIFLIFFYSVFRNEIINDAYNDIHDEVIHQQIALDGWIAHHEALLELVGSSPQLIQQQDQRLQFFQAFLVAHTDFKSIVLFDRNGDYTMSAPPLASANVVDREYFIRARNGLTTVTSPLISRITGDVLILVTAPVRDSRGDFDGVIVGAIRLKNFFDEFSLSAKSSISRPFIVEASDHSLLSDPSREHTPVIIPPVRSEDSSHSYINSDGLKVIGAFAPVNNNKWLVIIERPFGSTLQKMELFLFIFASTSLASIIILIPLIKSYTATLVNPIKTISSISTVLLNDKSITACPYIDMKNKPVEISTLYKNFCNMAEKISAYVLELKQRSLTDPLTSLANRRCLETEGSKIIEVCRRNGAPCSCLVLDLDHFKHVNDTYGHQAGDVALQTVSKIIKRNTRAADVCARFGGEEFTILATATPLDKATVLAERIRVEIEATEITYNAFSFHITASIGVSQLTIDSKTAIEIIDNGIKNADIAMYRAKENGRNRVEIHQYYGENTQQDNSTKTLA